jgi:hypothetical protein
MGYAMLTVGYSDGHLLFTTYTKSAKVANLRAHPESPLTPQGLRLFDWQDHLRPTNVNERHPNPCRLGQQRVGHHGRDLKRFAVAVGDRGSVTMPLDDQFVDVTGFGGFEPVQREVIEDQQFDVVWCVCPPGKH